MTKRYPISRVTARAAKDFTLTGPAYLGARAEVGAFRERAGALCPRPLLPDRPRPAASRLPVSERPRPLLPGRPRPQLPGRPRPACSRSPSPRCFPVACF